MECPHQILTCLQWDHLSSVPFQIKYQNRFTTDREIRKNKQSNILTSSFFEGGKIKILQMIKNCLFQLLFIPYNF